MKKISTYSIVLILLVCLWASAAPAQTQDKISLRLQNRLSELGEIQIQKVWIFFADKGQDLSVRLEQAEADMSSRAILRRLRHATPIDQFDVPVYSSYVESIQPYVRRIRQVSRWLNAVSVEVDGTALNEISRLPFVRSLDLVASRAWRDPKTEIDVQSAFPFRAVGALALDYGDSIFQLQLIKVPTLHELGYSGKGVLICMLDTGFNALNHEALDHLDIVDTWDFVNNDPIVRDETDQAGSGNHGTATLSTIAGYQPGTLIGPAYNASFLLGKTENTEWERHVEEDHWVAGAEWADAKGADIISSSLGYGGGFTDGEVGYTYQEMDGETAIVTRAANIAGSRGILIVNSAGNEGDRPFPINSIIAPSDSDMVLAVGATNYRGARVSFSSVGPTYDGRLKPDIMAMGANVVAAVPDALDAYALVNGTSFSCPLAAGVAALLLEAHPTWTNLNIMQALRTTGSNTGNPDHRNGWGVIDAVKALAFEPVEFYAPRKFKISRLRNDYIFFLQYVDRLTWEQNPLNTVLVQKYRIYSRPAGSMNLAFNLLTELDAGVFSYDRRGLLQEETFSYMITSLDGNGNESLGAYTIYR